MRIVHVVPNLGVGGAETMIVDLAVAQAENGDNPIIVALWPCEGNHIDRQLTEVGVPVYYLNKQKGFDFDCIGDLRRTLKRCAPDVIHTHRDALPYVLLARPMSRSRIVHTVHNSPAREAPRFISRSLRMAAFKLGRAVPIALSGLLSDEVCRFYRLAYCHAISNGVPSDSPLNKSVYRSGKLVFVGRLHHDKNPALALHILQVLRARGVDASLDIYGDGPLRGVLEKEATAQGLDDSVRFLGIHSDIRSILPLYDIFLNTSRVEGMPISILEAMVCGLPVVASGVGGVGEMLGGGEFGCIVESEDTNGYALAILGLLQNSAEYDHKRDIARCFATEHFGSSSMASAYRQVYCTSIPQFRVESNCG